MKSVRVIFRSPKKTKQNPPKKPTTKKAKEKKKPRTTQLFSPTQLRLTGPPNNTHLNLIKFVPVAYELLGQTCCRGMKSLEADPVRPLLISKGTAF